MGEQMGTVEATAERDWRDKPLMDLLDEKILCCDEDSESIIEYTVTEYRVSGTGEYVVLEDQDGEEKRVTAEELQKIRVD
jgi:hypothetical protein